MVKVGARSINDLGVGVGFGGEKDAGSSSKLGIFFF